MGKREREGGREGGEREGGREEVEEDGQARRGVRKNREGDGKEKNKEGKYHCNKKYEKQPMLTFVHQFHHGRRYTCGYIGNCGGTSVTS